MRAPLILSFIISTQLCFALAAQVKIRFEELSDSSKLIFQHHSGDTQNRGLLPSMMASGLATFDYDNDGRTDVYLLNGKPLELSSNNPSRSSVRQKSSRQALFRN